MFQLTKDECLRSQIATLNEGRGQHLKYMPYVFTENGVSMLSSVLNSNIAVQINIGIMRAFVALRQMTVLPKPDVEKRIENLERYIEEMFSDQNDINEDTRIQLELINQTLAELQVQRRHLDQNRQRIGFVKNEK